MAQADSVPSSTRQLITGESANRSTNLRAVNLPAVAVKPVDRRHFTGSLDARVILDTDEASVRLWRGKRGDVERENLLNGRWCGPSPVPMGSFIAPPVYVTLAFFLRWVSRSVLLILPLLLGRKKRPRSSALDKVSSNQLVRSKPQERLR